MTAASRPPSALLAGTPCDSLKTLLEPFSVPLLGKNQSQDAFFFDFFKVLFPNSGTLKGSSRLFKESQGVPARSAEPCRAAVSQPTFALKTYSFSAFLVLVSPKSF